MDILKYKVLSVFFGIIIFSTSIFSVYKNKYSIPLILILCFYIFITDFLPKNKIKLRYIIALYIATLIIVSIIVSTSNNLILEFKTNMIVAGACYIPVSIVRIITYKN